MQPRSYLRLSGMMFLFYVAADYAGPVPPLPCPLYYFSNALWAGGGLDQRHRLPSSPGCSPVGNRWPARGRVVLQLFVVRATR